jgi:hypothetical protein
MDGVFNSIELAGTSAAEKDHDYKILFGVAIAAVAVMVAIFALATGPHVGPAEIAAMSVFP